MGLKDKAVLEPGGLRNLSSIEFSAIPDGLVDNFEELLYEDEGKTISDRYAGNTAQYERNTDSPVIRGDYSLKHTGSDQNTPMVSVDLPREPVRGDTFAYFAYPDNQTPVSIVFGYTSDSETYALTFSGDNFRLYKDGFGGDEVIGDTPVSLSGGEWYDVEIDWADPTITCRVFSVDQSSGDRQSEEASFSADDTDYDNGQCGYFSSFRPDDTGVFDDIRVID